MLVLALACSSSDVDSDLDTDGLDTDTEDTDVVEPSLDPATVAHVLDEAAKGLRRSKASGAQVAIWLDGEVYYVGAVGSADPAKTRTIDEDTLFQIGSDTKKMTAIALLQAVERGDLALDDSLATAIPDLAFTGANPPSTDITMHELLSHQTGLYDYTPWNDAPDDDALAGIAYGEFAGGEPAMNPPGLMWNYANPNFSLAGLAVEVAAGRPYADVLEDDVIAPLGLTRTFARQSEIDGNAATGRGIVNFVPAAPFDAWGASTYDMATLEPADQPDNAFIRPAGLVWSTASDMCRLAGFLVDGDSAVLRDDLRVELSEPQVRLYPAIDDQSYGYGLFVLGGFSAGTDYIAAPLWAHGGNTLTMTSLFYVLPEQRMAVCILSNGYGDDFSAGALAALQAWGDLPAPSTRPTPPPPLSDLSKYVGNYSDPTVGRILVTRKDAALGYAMPDLAARGYAVGSTLTPSYQDMFTFKLAGADYDLTWIDGYLRNRTFVGTLDDSSALSFDREQVPGGDAQLQPEIPTSLAPLLR